MKKIKVSAGILINHGQVLCLQRGPGKHDYISYKYEFPGGKIESEESPTEALKRELMEEMNVTLNDGDMEFFMTVNHQYPDFHIIMHSYICNVDSRTFELLEHVNYQWLCKNELNTLDWAEADLPIVRKLIGETDK